MDLALDLGFRTVAELKRTMRESELAQWYRYAARKSLPTRRIELLLANIARMLTTDGRLSQFVFDPTLRESLEPRVSSPANAVESAAAISAVVGGAKIFKLGQRKVLDHGQ